MNWISKFLRKTDAKPSVPSNPIPAQAAITAEDIEGLRGLFATTRDEEERSKIAARLGLALAGRTQAPRAGDPAETWVAAIGHAPDKTLAQAWLAELKEEPVLAEVATRARMAEIRFAAVQRIESSALLEHVAQASRDKDKRIYRHCADLLKQRRQVDASLRRALEITAELRGLLESHPLPLSRLLELKNELGGLEQAGEAFTECHGLLEQALTRVREETEAVRDLHAHQNAAVALASECAGAPWPWTERIDAWRTRFDTLSQARARLPAWLASQASARALGESLGAIASCLDGRTADDERVLACDTFFTALEAGLPPESDASAMWAALAKPDHPEARQAMASRWQTLSASLKPVVASPLPADLVQSETPAPAKAPGPQAKLDHDALRGQLDKLEKAIGEGHLIDADAAAKQIKAALAGKALHGALEYRWHDLQAQVETLRGWARWGTEQAREKLIASAGELLVGARDVEELAVAIPALREEWKRLNAHAPASKAQWEHFDATLEKAYEPVAVHRAEQAARHAEARAVKEALCAEWEAGTDGDQADFKALEARRAEMINQWRAAPQAGFRDERALRKRFDALIDAIDKRLDEARAAEFARREQLILAAEALREQTDPRRAIAEAKALQQSWSKQATPVRLKRGDEQKLWQRFRAACDVVFARLDAQRAEQAAEREKQAQSRQALLDAFAASLTSPDANEIKRAVSQFRTDWDATRPGTREPADKLDTLARNLQEQARRRLDELRQAKQRSRYELLAQKSALAERVEAAALAAEPIEPVVAEVEQAWRALPDLPGKVERILAKRLADASAITAERLAAGHDARESLLLDLEIALGLPSPATHAEIRRERQLDRLQNRFGGGLAQASEPEEMLASWYATPALPVPASAPRIAAIVQHLAAQTTPGTER